MTSRFTAKWIPSILAYSSASICMTLTNKLVLSGFQFKLPFLILAVQATSSVLLLEGFTLIGLTKHRTFSRDDVRRWYPVSILMAIMLYTGSKSLQFLPVPIFTIFKNMSIILVAYGESRMFGGQVSLMMLFSFMLMILSSVIAAIGDLQFASLQNSYTDSVAGYWWMTANCISSALFVLFMRHTLKHGFVGVGAFKDFDTVYYNNLLTAPMFLSLSLLGADGKTQEFWQYYYGSDQHASERNSFFLAVLFSGVSAFWISYASSWCMRVTNSTTYSMVGALNKLPIALSSLLFFNDTPITVYSVGSIALGFFSGMMYTVAKLRQDSFQKSRSELPIAMSSEDVRIDGSRAKDTQFQK